MVKQFLKIAGVNTEKEFLKKYPTEEAFFRAHPEAMELVKQSQQMAYGGMYKYGPGGVPGSPIMPGTLMPAIKQAALEQITPNVLPAAPVVGPVQPAEFAAMPSAPSYQGVSIVDLLNARDPSGKSSSKAARKELAESMGISNYTGTEGQNRQLIELLGGKWDVSKAILKKSAKKSTAPASSSDGLLGGFKSSLDINPYTPTYLSSSKTAATGSGKKVDPYLNIIEKSVGQQPLVDNATRQYFNEELDKALGKVALSGVGLGGLNTLMNYLSPQYYPYSSPYELPPPGPIAGQRALPPNQKMLPSSTPRGWTMREGTYRSPNYPLHKMGGQPCYNCGGMYNKGGQTFNPGPGTFSGNQFFPYGGTYIPQPMLTPGELPQYMYGMGMAEGGEKMPQWLAERRFAAAGNTDKMSQYGYANGGLVKGSVHDMSEDQIQDLINQGYKIEYI